MAPNTDMFDNQNENSIDPNPYAYPYFHSNESTPLLYHLIVTHFSNASNPLLLNHYQSLLSDAASASASSSTTNTDVHSEKIIARRRKFIARRIQSRCQGRPQEAKWVDSCGENALFRFCQLIRFRKEDQLQHHQQHQHQCQYLNHYQHHNSVNSTSPATISTTTTTTTRRKIKLDNTADLIFHVLHSFIDIDSNALNTLNKWGETPLHQFVAHCGFLFFDEMKKKQNEQLQVQDQNQYGHGYGLSYQFLESMLQAYPTTVHQTNFQSALPLHLACSLSQLNNDQPFSSSDAMVSMNKLFSFSSATNATDNDKNDNNNDDITTTANLNNHSQIITNNNIKPKTHEHTQDHLKIVQRLVEYYPKGVLSIDINGCTPLFRAVDSIHSSSDITLFLLQEMELLFMKSEKDCSRDSIGTCCYCCDVSSSGGNEYEYGKGEENGTRVMNDALLRSCNTTKFLFYKAIMGFKEKIHLREDDDNDNNSNNSANRRSFSFDIKTKDEMKKVASPIEVLWKTILVRRQVNKRTDVATTTTTTTNPWLDDDTTCSSIAEVIEVALKRHENGNGEIVKNLIHQFGNVWEKVIYLICCAFHGSTKVIAEAKSSTNTSDDENDKLSLFALHAGIYCAAPSCVLNLLLRLYPNDLLKRDENGNTPLMLSLICPPYSQQWQDSCLDSSICSSNSIDGNGNNSGGEKASNLKRILQAAPEAAIISNKQGRLPLHIAIEKRINWDEGLDELFKANSGASSMKDPESDLLPFMLASKVEESSNTSSCTHSPCSSLDRLRNSYMILRADPSIVNMFVL